ncbi:MAG: hypothetical protein ACYCWW_00050 [Deltaproteobacteria bacterium]
MRAEPEQLLGRAARVLADVDGGWVTSQGFASALRIDEQTSAQLLERLVDDGGAQEARTQDGRTVYRAVR